ncbi:hypothetical protein CRE_05862 [Caenorhabditis remanei]|uniref:Uncharacterized protein n=1 Tax=Caenorhabditis remanei TaxID=31234 RepID=E3MNR9_CAERE|nr:hypothetical protein CRE_05862 [Caenorhabditis remanei]
MEEKLLGGENHQFLAQLFHNLWKERGHVFRQNSLISIWKTYVLPFVDTHQCFFLQTEIIFNEESGSYEFIEPMVGLMALRPAVRCSDDDTI